MPELGLWGKGSYGLGIYEAEEVFDGVTAALARPVPLLLV